MIVSHECPKALLEKSFEFNDYDYFLPAFAHDEDYLNHFITAREISIVRVGAFEKLNIVEHQIAGSKIFHLYISNVRKIFSPKFAFVTLQQTSDIWIR